MEINRGRKLNYQKALNLIKNNNVTDAIKELKLCLKFNSKDVLALNLLGLGYYLKCRFDKAEKQWRQSLSIERKNNQAADYLELITKKDFSNLRKQYKEILFNDSAAKSKKINFLKNIIEKHDELIEPYLILGLLYKEDGNYQEALKYLYQAYDLDSGNQNVKNYIFEFENKESNSRFFNLDKFDLSRFNLNSFKISKYKKEFTILIIAMLAVFLIFILSNGQPSELKESTKVADKTVQNETVQNEEANIETNKNKTKVSKGNENNSKFPNNNKNNSSNDISENNLNQLDLDLNIIEYQSLSNLVFLDLNRNIKSKEPKEPEKKQNKAFEQYFDEKREQELFNLGLQRLRSQRYEEAVIIFKNLYKLSEAEYLRRESLYFLARNSQLEDDFEAAEKYYRLYIDNYPDTNYYDDALYNLGLLLNEQDKLANAKQVMQKLRTEKPYSSYNNSKVYNILNKDS